jgi:hypothetical protein
MAKTLENGELEAKEIATAGIITDDYNNTWTLPVDGELGEDFDFNYSPLDFPRKDPRFHYQFEKTEKLGWILAEQFVPVRRSEIGLARLNDANRKMNDYGVHTNTDEDPIHQVGDLTLVKIPVQIAAKRYARAAKEADRVKAGIEPPKKFPNARAELREKWEASGQKIQEDVVVREEHVKERS